MKTRRVLISAYFDPALPGGGSQYSVDMAREWVRMGHEVHVICSDHARQLGTLQESVSENRLIFHPMVSANRLLLSHEFHSDLYDRAAELLKRLAPETIFIHNFHGLLSAVQAAVDSGRRTVYTALDFGLLCHSWYLYDGSLSPCSGPDAEKCRSCLSTQQPVSTTQRLLSVIPSGILRVMGKNADYFKQYGLLPKYYAQAGSHLQRMRPLLKQFDVVLTISPVLARILSESGVDSERIHFGVQGADFPVPKHVPTSSNVRLIFLGHMAPIKGFQVIVEAASALPDGLNLEIRTYGSDAERYVQGLSSAAQRYIQAFPILIEDGVERELAEADALIIPSLWRENSPYAVLRALASGRPVIASDQEGVSHLVKNSQNGFLLSPGDVPAWKELLEKSAREPGLLRQLRSHCSYKKSVRDYAAEIEEVLSTMESRVHA